MWLDRSLCSHMQQFNRAKISIELFSFTCFPVSVVRQRNENEAVTETQPIKTLFSAEVYVLVKHTLREKVYSYLCSWCAVS